MGQLGAYGDRLGLRMGIEAAPALVTRALRQAEIAVTEIRSDRPVLGELSESLPGEDAFLVALQVRDYSEHHYWEERRKVGTAALRAGDTTIYDLRRDPQFLINAPFHSIHFYLSRSVMNAIADDSNARRIGDLQYRPGCGMDDATVRSLGSSLARAFETPEQFSRIFMDHVTLALAAHVAQAYGGMAPHTRTRGGLAPWQERRAKERFSARLDGDIVLKEVATECGLSVSHFSRAFRQSVGIAPHAWLLRRRVEVSQDLLRNRRWTLSEVALACGFADQSHFTRVFTREVGVSPGAWRRRLEE